jgi:hypothetical protein
MLQANVSVQLEENVRVPVGYMSIAGGEDGIPPSPMLLIGESVIRSDACIVLARCVILTTEMLRPE